MLLTSGMAESRQREVDMPDVNREICVKLLHFMYTDTLDAAEPDLLMPLLVAASTYTLERLVRLCEGRLAHLLDTENASSFLQFADIYSLSHIRIAATSFILRHYEEVTKTQSFSEMPAELRERFEKMRLHEAHAYLCDVEGHNLQHANSDEYVASADLNPPRPPGQACGKE